MDINTLKTNTQLMKCIRQNLSLSPDDESKDDKISKMSKREVFERYLNWQNVVGYANPLMSVYQVLKDSLEDGKISHDHLAANDNDGIIEAIRKNANFPDYEDANFNEKKFDDFINSLTLESALHLYMKWHGLGLNAQTIINALETIEKSQ